ncbi:ABC-2 type transport system ATP-binding protein [Flavobacterium nitrogenifigens]|uniref:ABC-2 type transport system ATP-binding protein n=2 Tax=Flavobacterium TaxID=237 RepID=A0A7W7N7M8_9FLAO|nr:MULTISPECIES: ATP-binding cassette domain-containing protein [Flavobacterium]MBB4801634.1 ABC-2 type transport system ATP-binding protein [Flavobacterium nitrogenifigens]MBB6386592.1 ABC-2 type transport system ATP-binding protein [Flavobacterium notoginsengisoli]
METTTIVRVEDLSHQYSKDWAIQNINFEIKENRILGLLGSNGAGKSTTMNILCGVLNQTKGNIFIDGINLKENPVEAKKLIGFLPQTPPLHLDLTVDEYLIHCAQLRLVPKENLRNAVEKAKEKCGISHFSHRLIKNLSGGYRQRVGIAQAIIHEPKLVVLDEPTNGLDPNQILEVRNLIKKIAQDKAVIFSSHILSEVQATCQDIKMIENGHMVFSDTLDAFNNYIEADKLTASFENPPAVEAFKEISEITEAVYLTPKKVQITFSGTQEVAEKIVSISVQKNWKLREIQFEKVSLDEIFAQLSKKAPSKNAILS